MRILIYCPLHASYPRLYAKCMTALFELDADTTYELCFGVSRGQPDADVDRLSKLERARQMAIDGDYDGLLTVAHDVQVPADTVGRLLAVDAPAVAAVTASAEWPHDWQTGSDSGCLFCRREILTQEAGIVQMIQTIPDLYCTRITMAYGGMAITPDPDAPDRVAIEYFDPAQAPAGVPYTRTLLARKAA